MTKPVMVRDASIMSVKINGRYSGIIKIIDARLSISFTYNMISLQTSLNAYITKPSNEYYSL